MGLRHATPDPSLLSEGERGARQATISLARLRRAWISGFPSPHHATRPLASKEVPPHLVMQARKKHSVQHVVKAAFGARIGAIEGKCPLLPAKPDHGAPLLHHCVFFGHEHWNFLHSHDGHMTASINATAGSPPKPANALSEVTFQTRASSRPTNLPFSQNPSPALKRSN